MRGLNKRGTKIKRSIKKQSMIFLYIFFLNRGSFTSSSIKFNSFLSKWEFCVNRRGPFDGALISHISSILTFFSCINV